MEKTLTVPESRKDFFIYLKKNSEIICIINKTLLYLQCVNDTEMFDKVEGLNDREEMLDHLRFLIRYEKQILDDGTIFSESEFYDELFDTIIMIADNLKEE